MKTLKEFHEIHSFPDQTNVEELYKFMTVNDEHPEYLEQLFINLRLYHALPSSFNDPFECKPHYKLPTSKAKIDAIRRRLAIVGRRHGNSKKASKRFARDALKDKSKLEEGIKQSAVKRFGQVKVCSYTTSKSNLLLWSHYADSHRGICIEFNANLDPMRMSMKVKYQDEYPQIEYPLPQDARGFESIFTKSSQWSYEDEYRSLLIAAADNQPPHDDVSFFIRPGAIIGVYLGSQISPAHTEIVLNLIRRSESAPRIWKAEIADDTFSINFKRVAIEA
jgi:hypothetical protein